MKKLLLGVFAAIAIIAGSTAALPQAAYAADPTGAAQAAICDGVEGQTGGTCAAGSGSINKTIKTIVRIFSIVAGVLAVIMIIFAGMKYITSGGDASAVGSAKKTVIYAIVGLVVVAAAQLIVRSVLKNV